MFSGKIYSREPTIGTKRRQAKSVCIPSSREMSSLEEVRPGIRPRFLCRKMDAEKKMPPAAAKAIKCSPKLAYLSEIHETAQSALRLMQGTVKKNSLSGQGL